jgi:hypothetical protein
MLVRYRTNSSCTLQNFKDDINNIILGNITSVNDLSAGADKVNSIMYGTYPTGKYARVNGTSFTYSKLHNAEATYTHYFRLTFDTAGLTTLALAQGYTSGTDTLLNSFSQSCIVVPAAYTAAQTTGIEVLVSTKTFSISISTTATKLSVTDLGHTGVTRQYTSSMLMALNDHTNTAGAVTSVCPYSWNFDTSSYSSLSVATQSTTSNRKGAGNGITTIFENPIFATFQAPALIYGTYKIPYMTFSGPQVYKDASNNYRLTINDISFLVD